MNDNIDLTKILEGCPVGTKFYSTIYGKVDFSRIISDDYGKYPIELMVYNKDTHSIAMGYCEKDGTFSCDYEGEDRRPYRYVNSQKQGGESNHSGFKDTTNDGESSCFAKVAVPVRYEVCHRDSNSEKCAANVHCETSGCCCRGEPPEKKLGDQNDGCKDGD